MKKIISLFLTVTMIASLIVAIPVTNVAAAETITDEALFMTYPTYLSNSEMDEGLAKAEAAYYAVINSYSDSDETVAALMTSMSEGISILVKQGLANLGIGETLYETQAREAATKYMQSMLTNENVIKKASGMVDKAYKTLKTSYSIASNVDKTTMMADLVKVATENDISIKPDDIDDLVNDLYDAGSLKTDLAAIGEANKLWKIVFEFTEIHAIEKTTLDLLMDELFKSGQTGSDLYLGLSLLKKDMEKDSASYVLKYYATDKAVSYLADKADDLIGAVTSANAVSLVTTFMKVFADYIYVNAKAEDLTQAIMQTSFVSSIDICLSQYRLKFLQGTGTTEDMKTYESLYGAYLAAHKATLDTCYDIAKITDKFSLGGDCMIWSSNIETLYTYDKYIEWCKKEISHDISNSELDKTTGSSTITDALNEETIASRLERVFRLYPAGSKWAGEFGGTRSSLGYAGKVFNHIFDKTMGSKVENDYQYILTSNKNVRLIGRLEEKGVTEAALRDLFANVRIGDVVITSGQYDYLHAMTVVGMGETGPIVYDVDSKYGPAEEYTHLIQKYEFPYSKMADAFSKNGKYLTKPGISVYRAIKKVNTTNSGTSLYYEEYDDSVNYVIENGVLTGYKGSRTTIEIPDGVTSIAANCFNNNTSIKYVYMPDTVVEIKNGAFAFCSNLQYIKFSNSLTDISANAFNGCKSLKNVILPNNLEYIGAYCFYNSGLTSVNIPDSVGVVEWHSFEDCIGLTTVTIGKNVYILGEWAFAGCDYLSTIYWRANPEESDYYSYEDAFTHCGNESGQLKIVFEDMVTKIPDGVMDGCYCLIDVEFPESLTRIGDRAFAHCRNLKSITIPESVSYIGDDAFSFCDSIEYVYWNAVNAECPPYGGVFTSVASDYAKGMKVIFGENVKSIPSQVLMDCNHVTEIIIGENVETIGSWAFSGCEIKELVFPDKVKTIGGGVIQNCKSLETVTLPAGLNHYNVIYIFWGVPKLTNIYISSSNELFESIGGVLYQKNNVKSLVMVPEARTTVNIPESCKEIVSSAFSNACNLREITVEKGNSAFTSKDGDLYSYDQKKLIKYAAGKESHFFEIPHGVTTIGYTAFDGSNNLYEIKIPDTVKDIEDAAFLNCKNLKNIVLPKSITLIPDFAFNLSGISNITIPDTVTQIGMYAFQCCENIKSINIPDSIKEIKEGAFAGCSNITDIYYTGSEADWKKINIENNNDPILSSTIHYNYTTKTNITSLTVDDLGNLNLSAINVPVSASICVASYDTLGKLLELQNLTLNNGSASAIFQTANVFNYKAFIWKGDNIRPLSDTKEHVLN